MPAEEETQQALALIEGAIANCTKIQPRLKEGSPQLSLNRRRIRALEIARSLLAEQGEIFPTEELAAALPQLSSIRSKSLTGLAHAKPGSATAVRFERLVQAMETAVEAVSQAQKEEPRGRTPES